MISTGQVMKIDEKGHARASRSRQDELLDEYERSGLSAPKFAALAGIKYPTFAYWMQRRRKERQSAVAKPAGGKVDPVRWLEAVVDQAASPVAAAGLIIHLPGKARMEVLDKAQVLLAAQLLNLLEAQPPQAC
jgi:hypothetical protein